jgi:alkylation response protein AidB-like acyl-CoA dehydrogenase
MSLFALNEDQCAVQQTARSFADERIAPHAIDWDQAKHFAVDVIREAAALGLCGIYVREDIGGIRT